MKLLHISDVYLDTSFAGENLPAVVGEARRTALRERLSAAGELAREREVDALTIAGNLYDQRYVVPQTVDFLRQQFEALAPLPVIIAPGQHDPYTPQSPYALWDWSKNVFILSQPSFQPVELPNGAVVWGAAHPIAAGYPLLQNLSLNRDAVNIALLNNTGAAHRNELAFKDAGFDFALLGGEALARTGDGTPFFAYPGSLEALTAATADGDHSALLLTIAKGAASVEVIPTAQWQYESIQLDVGDFASLKALSTYLAEAVTDDSGVICTVELSGEPPFPLDLNTAVIPTSAYLIFRHQLSIAENPDRLAAEPTVRGEFVRRLSNQWNTTDDAAKSIRLQNTLYLALRALNGHREVTNAIDAD